MEDLYTYIESMRVLNISESTLKRAIANGVLTPIKAKKSVTKYLSKAEVDSYIGKPLKKTEEKQTEEKQIEAKQTEANLPSTWSLSPSGDAIKYLVESGASLKVDTPAGQLLFQLALAGSDIMGPIILLGLLTLLYVVSEDKEQVAKDVRAIFEKIGLTEEALSKSTRAPKPLENHPQEMEE